MKKILLSLFILATALICTKQANAITYEEALEQQKPIALLIYANWADDLDVIKKNFDTMQTKYGQLYNFVLLDIASPDAKSYNKKNVIQPNLPHVLLLKENGRITRQLYRNCILDTSCFSEKLTFFVNG